MKKILVLDDDTDILDVVGEILTYEKFEVKSISESTELIPLAETYLPDLILLDYRLTGKNGGELCRQVKTSAKLKHIPVIIFTAYPTERLNLKQFGCDEVITKPFDMNYLVDKINALLSPPPAQKKAAGSIPVG